MKKILLLLFISPLMLVAQDFIPILQEGNQWSIKDNTDFNSGYYFQFTVSDSEIVNGIEYKKLFSNGEETSCRLREENGKIFRLNQNLSEALVIDFSLEVNDQFLFDTTYNLCHSEYIFSVDRLQVISTSIEIIAGIQRKVLNMQGYNNEYPITNVTQQWIEGIGSTRAFFPDYYGTANGAEDNYLNCFTHHEVTTFFNDATTCGVELNVSNFSIEEITLYPNPVTSTSILKLPNDGNVYIVKFYDLLGKLIKEEIVTKDWVNMDFINYKSGLYFYQVYSKNQILKTAQFLVK